VTEAIRVYLPWLLSAITIYMTLLQGNKNRLAWVIGLIGQAGWLVYIVGTKAWGLLPLNATLWVLYARNYCKWSKA
jgi:hypothetical protein